MTPLAADTLLVNGTFITMDPARPTADCLAIKNGKIAELIIGNDYRAWVDGKTEIIDLKGAFVYPGFIDTHIHILYTGINKKYLQLQGCKTKEAILTKLKECKSDEPWIIGFGWDDHGWGSDDPLTADDLDACISDKPVVLVREDTHLICVNSIALELVHITRDTPSPEGGYIGKDASGKPNGILIDRASYLVRKMMPQSSNSEEIILEVLNACLEKGITRVHNASTDEKDLPAFKVLSESGKLPLHVHLMRAIGPTEAEMIQEGPKRFSDHLEMKTLKFWMDGALGSRGACLCSPYSDHPESAGLLLWQEDDLIPFLTQAKQKGFQVAIHAIGDQATKSVLNAYEKIGVKGLRWRIEHAQQLDPTDVKRFRDMEVIASVQPLHLFLDMKFLIHRLGPERTKYGSFIFRTLLDEKVTLAGGSDAPVVDFNPLLGIHAAITRQLNTSPFTPEQRISPYEALKMYTADAAYALFAEETSGTLAQGKLANLTILPENILECPPENLLTMKVLYTFINGAIKYRA